MVNDNVMGGRSKGDVRIADGVMTFFGAINTNGGGFSSVRLPIDRGTLAGASQIVLRVKHDGRVPYRLLVIDEPGRSRRTLHQRQLSFDAAPGEWQTVSVELSKMQPTRRGDPIVAAPLDPAAAIEIGFILNDATDGPFELQIDWIDITR
jgi:NADH dehydrogenase [ubiquinone] 1 alpha subcomplex assembly factor 1